MLRHTAPPPPPPAVRPSLGKRLALLSYTSNENGAKKELMATAASAAGATAH